MGGVFVPSQSCEPPIHAYPSRIASQDGRQNSPPQLRRGGAKRRGCAGQTIQFLDQHHPSRGLYLCFALTGSRFAASAFPSSAEEGSNQVPACTANPIWLYRSATLSDRAVERPVQGWRGYRSPLVDCSASRQ